MNVAIVGAGVAGLAAAALLSQQGHRVEVFERRAGIRSIGAGVMLWPDACAVLDRLRLLPDARAVGGKPVRLQRLSASDELITELDFASLAGSSPYTVLSILRSDLMSLLAKACRHLPIHYGAPISTTGMADLQQQFDLVLGCDGRMKSPSRQLIEQNAKPVYSGMVNVIGISRAAFESLSTVRDYWQPNLRFGVVPINDQCCYWAAAWCELKADIPPNSLEQVGHRFSHFPIQQILEQTEPGTVRTIAVHDLNPLTNWHSQNLLLLGDAAHAPLPTSGRGTTLALQNAAVLTDLLATAAPLETVLPEFYRLQQPRTTAVQTYGRQMAGQLFPDTVAHGLSQ